MAKQCFKCKHIRKITGNKKAKCLAHGISKFVTDLFAMTDRQKLKLIKLEMRLK